MDERQLANLTLQFLKNCPLKGADVPAFVEVNNWLNQKLEHRVQEEDGEPEA